LLKKLSVDEIVRALDVCLRAQAGLQGAVHPNLHVESLVVKLCLQRPLAVATEAPAPAPSAHAARAAAAAAPSATSSLPVAETRASEPRAPESRPAEVPRSAPMPAPSAPPSTASAAPASAASHAQGAGHVATLEAYIRRTRPAWTPVLQSLLSIDSDGERVLARAKADFAGKRLASPDGHEVLKAAFGVKRAEVSLESAGSAAPSPQNNFQEKKRLAKEHEAVLAAMKILDGTIQETKVLEDDAAKGRASGNTQKGDRS